MIIEKSQNAIKLTEDEDEENLEEEAGEEIESAPPQKMGEERQFHNTGITKKLLNLGRGYQIPDFPDEVTLHYVGTLLDGTKFDSTRDRGEPLTIQLGKGQVVPGLEKGIITMKKGECALFTLPAELAYGDIGHDGVPPSSIVQFEVELISWITVVDLFKDGRLVKKIMEKGESDERPGDLDEVLVKYRVAHEDGSVIFETPDEGVEFCVKDGHLCPAIPKAVVTMRKGEKVKLFVQPKYGFQDEGKSPVNGSSMVIQNKVLNVDLELVSFKAVTDVIGDCKVYKKILKEGEATQIANEGAAVTIRYRAKLEDDAMFEVKGFDGEEPLKFITDEEQVIVGLDRAVVTMRKGEKALLTIAPEYGFGNVEVKRDLAVVPACSKLIYEVEMLDFVKEKLPWEMGNQEKIEAAMRKKEDGNLLFKDRKYQRAGKKYDKAAEFISEDGSFVDDELKPVKALRVLCWLNGAACCLKLGDFQEVITLCSKVLDIESHNVKALYRRAQAYMETSDLILAEMDIKKALEADPHNREVSVLKKNLKQHQVESNKRDAKIFSNMFSRASKESSVAPKRLKVDINQEAHIKDEAAMAMDKEPIFHESLED